MKKKIIAVDIDDVLAMSAVEFVRFSNQRWGTRLTVEDYDEDWTKMWQIDHEATKERSVIWHASGVSAKKQPWERGYEALKELSGSYKLVVATSRQKVLEKDTIAWLGTYFKGVFSELHFSAIWDEHTPSSHTLTKAELCREIGADYLIDDQVKHCIGAAEVGLEALLFGDYSWNRHAELPEHVTRVKDWPAVLEYFNGAR